MEDKMVELRRFTLVSEAEILANLLKSEGVDCYVRDCFITQIYSGVDFGGVKIELLEKDLQRATEIMKAFGYGEEKGEKGEKVEGDEEVEGDERVEGDEGDERVEGDEGDERVEGDEKVEGDERVEGEEGEIGENILAEYERNRAKLSRTMTMISILIVILVVILIILNQYFNG